MSWTCHQITLQNAGAGPGDGQLENVFLQDIAARRDQARDLDHGRTILMIYEREGEERGERRREALARSDHGIDQILHIERVTSIIIIIVVVTNKLLETFPEATS